MNPERDAAVQVNVLVHRPDSRLDVILEDALGTRTLERPNWDYSRRPVRFKATAVAQTPFGTRPADFLMTNIGEHAFVFTLSTRSELDRSAHATTLDAIAASLQPIAPDDANALPVRLALVRANGSVDLAAIATTAGAPVDAVLALNGANPQTKPAAGSLVKMPL